MTQLFGLLHKPFRPAGKRMPVALEAKPDPLVRYFFSVCAVDGSAFTMEVLAPNEDVATRFVKRYPGIVSFDPVRPEIPV